MPVTSPPVVREWVPVSARSTALVSGRAAAAAGLVAWSSALASALAAKEEKGEKAA